MTTLDAHLVALDMKTGKVVWDVEIADYKPGLRRARGAPLVVKDKVIVGIAGGEFAIRGFLDAYDVRRPASALWRFWTVPAPGEPGSDTWPAESGSAAAAPTWLTGTYDPELNLLYWGTGNPNPDFYGDDRKGDNLYTGFAHRARRRHRHAEVAFPVHAARRRTTGTRTRSRCSRI